MHRTVIATLLLWLLGPLNTVLAASGIIVLQSSDNRFFQATVSSLRQELPPNVELKVVTLSDSNTPERAEINRADLLITLGFEAMQTVAAGGYTTPVLHAYLTQFQSRQHPAKPGHSNVLLDQPLNRYLQLTQLLLDVDSVGLIESEQNLFAQQPLKSAQSATHLDIQVARFRADDNLMDTLRNVLKRSDALLALPAPDIYNRNTLKGILLTTYRFQKAVISYSPAHVKSGALAAIFTSPENIGKQLADLFRQRLSNPQQALASEYFASDFDIAINDSVAQSLSLEIPERTELLQQLRELNIQ